MGAFKILNYGSLNIDYTYKTERIVSEGETVTAHALTVNCGGKGLNQSVAAAKYGANVYHAGKIGSDGDILTDKLKSCGVDVSNVSVGEGQSGHAIIQVDEYGQNCIIVYAGCNGLVTEEEIDGVLSKFDEKTYLLLQNEINNIPYIIDRAYEKGMKIVFNPSPITQSIKAYPLERVSLFMLNETEGYALTGETEPEKIIEKLSREYRSSDVLLTLGEKGSMFFDGKELIRQDIYRSDVVDTTAAGDTVTGFFVAALADGLEVREALKLASAAASITVSRSGAADSIPTLQEVGKIL